VDTIRDEVCEKYHIHLSMLGVDGRERKQDIEAEARRAYAWCLQQYAGLTLKEIARLLGLQDHTTVVYALKKVDKSFVPFLQLQAELIRMKAGRDG
jgi:chromosomal replication initiation ATPase DnaA